MKAFCASLCIGLMVIAAGSLHAGDTPKDKKIDKLLTKEPQPEEKKLNTVHAEEMAEEFKRDPAGARKKYAAIASTTVEIVGELKSSKRGDLVLKTSNNVSVVVRAKNVKGEVKAKSKVLVVAHGVFRGYSGNTVQFDAPQAELLQILDEKKKK